MLGLSIFQLVKFPSAQPHSQPCTLIQSQPLKIMTLKIKNLNNLFRVLYSFIHRLQNISNSFFSNNKKMKKMHVVFKSKVTKNMKSLTEKIQMPRFLTFPIGGCFDGCRDHSRAAGLGTRIWNLSDKPVELQIRVGSILKKIHTLKPGCSKRLKCKTIYKAYMPGGRNGSNGSDGGVGMKSLLYYYDETCQPYVWIHETGGNHSLRMVKQQYISLEDLRDCSEIRIFRDHQRGCISVRKKPRPDLC